MYIYMYIYIYKNSLAAFEPSSLEVSQKILQIMYNYMYIYIYIIIRWLP